MKGAEVEKRRSIIVEIGLTSMIRYQSISNRFLENLVFVQVWVLVSV